MTLRIHFARLEDGARCAMRLYLVLVAFNTRATCAGTLGKPVAFLSPVNFARCLSRAPLQTHGLWALRKEPNSINSDSVFFVAFEEE